MVAIRKKTASIVTRWFAYTSASMLIAIACIGSAMAAGGGAGGTTSTTGSGKCYANIKETYTTYQDECYGASWRLYDVGTPAAFRSDANTVATIDAECSKYGGQYYRLGLESFYTNGSRSRDKFTPTGKQRYFRPVKLIAGYGGGHIPYVENAGLAWPEVEADFQAAQEYARNHPESWTGNLKDLKWSDTSWFCWDASWRNDSGFTSNSTVSIPDGSDFTGITKTSPDDGETSHEIDTFDTEVTVTFWHNIKYKTGLEGIEPNAQVWDSAYTNWRIENSQEGYIGNNQYVTDARYNAVSPDLIRHDVTISVPRGTETKVCDYISYDPKHLDFALLEQGDPGFSWGTPIYRIVDTYDTGGSHACVTIKNTDTRSVGSFWSKSFVEVPAQNDVPGYKVDENTVSPNGSVSVKLSTDMDYLDVIFWHKMYYSDALWTNGTNDHFRVVCTDYNVSRYLYQPALIKEDEHCTGTKGSDFANGANSGKEIARTGVDPVSDGQPFRIQLPNPGDRVTVCESVNFDPANIVMSPTIGHSTHMHHPDVDTHSCGYMCTITYPHDHYLYTETNRSGRGKSTACVEVVRAKEPDLPGPFSGNSATSTSTYMYAGETTDIGWDTSAKGVAERRVAEYRAIEFLWHAAVPYSVDTISGTVEAGTNQQLVYPNRKNVEPCTWYNNKSRQEQCAIARDETSTDQQLIVDTPNTTYSSDGILYPYKKSLNIAVPDEVGYKLCNSFGYKWEYWYSITYDGVDNWQHETTKDYWNVFNASCRSIAKKPSMAVWNGSVFTTGQVNTSISQRFSNNTYSRFLLFNVASNNAGARLFYGSWDEYLGAIGGSVNGFATGTTFSRGNSDTSPYSESLTISNASDIGNSQIPVNSAAYIRLRNYLESRAVTTNDIGALGASSGNSINVTETKIISTNGDLTIDRNIVVPGGPYADVYSIPQAVIFVNGNVNIAPDVTRVDAWIIATGTLNTCNAFVTRGTGTTASAGSTHGVYTTNTPCDRQLIFNGPVMAGEVKLNRTGGSDPSVPGNFFNVSNSQRYTPAEVFNLRADTYLWAYAQAGRYGSSYTEAYTRELPPRY